jgi:hypothetical protein
VGKLSRRERWENLSEEEKTRANKEWRGVFEWAIAEEEKAFEKIKDEGRYLGGLDGYYPEYIEISNTVKERLKEIQTKYGIAPDDDSND